MCNFYFFPIIKTVLKCHGLHATVENNNKPEAAMKKTIVRVDRKQMRGKRSKKLMSVDRE